MIIVKMGGGLGNQMFMYALGRHLAIKNGDSLKLDLGAYKAGDYRKYSLGCFRIQEEFASREEVAALANPENVKFKRSVGIIGKFFGSSDGRKKTHVYEKRTLVFDPALLRLKGDIYLEGLFHDERYFKEIRSVICEDFSFKTGPEGMNKQLAGEIAATNSISVHVRRTDLITNKHFFDLHGVCSINYYKACIKLMSQKIKEPRFFVFSDDIAWARENIKFDAPAVFIDNNDEKHCYEDMRLMSLCKHNIIANSTFSWWAAWLNANSGKIVTAPVNWIRDTKKLKSKDIKIVPAEWIKVADE